MPKGIVRLDLDPALAGKSFAEIWGVEDAVREGDAGDQEKRARPVPGMKLEPESEGFMVRYLVQAINPGYEDMWVLVDNIHDTTGNRPRGLGVPGGEVHGAETALEALLGQEIAEIPRSWRLVEDPVSLFRYEKIKQNRRVWNQEGRLSLFLEKTSCFFVRVDTRPNNDGASEVPESVRFIEKQEIGDAIFFQTSHVIWMWEEADWVKELEALLKRKSGRGLRFNPGWLEEAEELLKKKREMEFFDFRLCEWLEKFEVSLEKRWRENWKYKRAVGRVVVMFSDPRPPARRFYSSHGPLFAEMLKKVNELKASGVIQ